MGCWDWRGRAGGGTWASLERGKLCGTSTKRTAGDVCTIRRVRQGARSRNGTGSRNGAGVGIPRTPGGIALCDGVGMGAVDGLGKVGEERELAPTMMQLQGPFCPKRIRTPLPGFAVPVMQLRNTAWQERYIPSFPHLYCEHCGLPLPSHSQTVAFLASLYREFCELPHLVVVPLSTMRNWEREFATWAPQLNVVSLAGNADARAVRDTSILHIAINNKNG